jgi:sugar phosphate isomerase/epimerase
LPVLGAYTAWTGSPTVRPFLPAEVAAKSAAAIEKWSETYLLRLLDLAAALEVKIIPMFWGVAFGWEWPPAIRGVFGRAAITICWQKGKERFVKKTAKIRAHANKLGIFLAHEIHPGTAAMCADDFNMLVAACDGDPCLAVNADPSHCWEGESWETRFLKVAPRVYACHVKNYVIRPGLPLRMMEGGWQKRAMQFVDIPTGDLNMTRYVELLIHIGYPRRYCAATKPRPLR